jgi:hypothetical protein
VTNRILQRLVPVTVTVVPDVPEVGEIEVMVGAPVTVRTAVPVTPTAVAFTLSVPLTLAAVYKPVLDIVPTGPGERLHVKTGWLGRGLPSLSRATAVKSALLFNPTVALTGVTVMLETTGSTDTLTSEVTLMPLLSVTVT